MPHEPEPSDRLLPMVRLGRDGLTDDVWRIRSLTFLSLNPNHLVQFAFNLRLSRLPEIRKVWLSFATAPALLRECESRCPSGVGRIPCPGYGAPRGVADRYESVGSVTGTVTGQLPDDGVDGPPTRSSR